MGLDAPQITELDIARELLSAQPPHPLLPLPTPEQVLNCLRSEGGRKQLAELLELRSTTIANANHDPLRHLLEPPYWQDIRDQITAKMKNIIILGGNRCLAGDSMIFDPVAGTSTRIDEIKSDFHVHAWDGTKRVIAKALRPFRKDDDVISRIQLSSGNLIYCSPKHLLMGFKGEWVEAANVREGTELRTRWLWPDTVASVALGSNPVPIWDFTVPEHHNYFHQGVIHHNSGKSFVCGKLTVEAVITHPGTLVVCVSEDEKASIETQQNIVWKFLPPDLKAACHNKRDPSGVFYLNYNEANGFSERKIVLPKPKYHRGNPSKILFATYNENPGDYEGMEFGHAEDWTVAWWADENLRLNWLQMFMRRGKFRPGTGLWSYTPIHGITPTIKEAVGKTAVTLKTRQAKLLQDRVNVPGLKKGEMPYMQIGAIPNSRVFYFHSEMSPFGPGPNGSGKPYAESVAEDCKGKPTEYIKRIAYGYTEDVIGLCYPKFRRDVHVVKPEDLPEEGTNYCYIDPAGERNWFLLWVRVACGNPRRFYIYREWPDMARYGEWAVPSSRVINQDTRKGWDGDRGPAQRNQGWGVVRYKTLMLTEETIAPTIDSEGCWTELDPLRRKVLDEAMAGAEIQPLTVSEGRSVWNEAKLDLLRQRHPDPIREPIRLRKLDPRAAVNTQASEKGGTNLVNLFAMETRKSTGELEAPRMTVLPAYTGKGRIDDGVSHVAQLLDYNEDEPVCPVINEPKLYVSDYCKQLIWMFENYTSLGGEEGGCKDPADLVRYLAQDDDARHIAPGGKLAVAGNLMSQ